LVIGSQIKQIKPVEICKVFEQPLILLMADLSVGKEQKVLDQVVEFSILKILHVNSAENFEKIFLVNNHNYSLLMDQQLFQVIMKEVGMAQRRVSSFLGNPVLVFSYPILTHDV
jgi:hypothetical protein